MINVSDERQDKKPPRPHHPAPTPGAGGSGRKRPPRAPAIAHGASEDLPGGPPADQEPSLHAPPTWVTGLDEDIEDLCYGLIRIGYTHYDALFSHESESRRVLLTVRVARKVRTNPDAATPLPPPQFEGVAMQWNWTPSCDGLLRLDAIAPVTGGTEHLESIRETLVHHVGRVLTNVELQDFLTREQAHSCGQPYRLWKD